MDLGFARTEAHFMWAETSNLRGTDVPRLHEKRTSTGCISLVIRARDGARGPGDLGAAPTEAHFMWAETSNLRGTDVPRKKKKDIQMDVFFLFKESARRRTRSGGPRPAQTGAERRHRTFEPRPTLEKKNDTNLVSFFFQARDGDRTRDPLLGKEVLHR